jgi:hypothetical protein
MADIGEETDPGQGRTIIGPDGRVLFFNCERFVADICLKDNCFICGAERDSKPFNDEHVIPRWILRRFNLFDRSINLPDGRPSIYNRYTMPCCVQCNSFLGLSFETPMSQLLAGGHDEIVPRLNVGSKAHLFTWLCLLFLKLHLKDRTFRRNLDRRLPAGSLADGYHWPDLHHLHCVVRIPFVEASVERPVFGSLLWFKVEDRAVTDTFDFADISLDQTVMVRLGDFAVIAVLNDAGASESAWRREIAKISGPVSSVQLREIAAMLATANSDLMERPVFGTAVDTRSETVRLYARLPNQCNFAPLRREKLGERMAFVLRDRMESIRVGGVQGEELGKRIRNGEVSFLFDQNGNFRPQQVLMRDELPPGEN